jgi:hypothetical protein
VLISRSCATILLLAALPLIAQADQATQARTLASQMIKQLGDNADA